MRAFPNYAQDELVMESNLTFWEYPPPMKYTNHKAKVIINLDICSPPKTK